MVVESTIAQKTTDEEAYEAKHVHEVYNQIASHFSATRHKPWPIVECFLNGRPKGSIGLDVGCGNGKNLLVNRDVFIVASDRSSNLVKLASKHKPHAAIVADMLKLPHQKRSFDFAISIAVVHHLSTRERRVAAIASLLESLTTTSFRGRGEPGASGFDSDKEPHGSPGELLLFVWALEQKGSRRGWDKNNSQDIMVPWVMKPEVMGESRSSAERSNSERFTPECLESISDSNKKSCGAVSQTFNRYYHLYREGELEEDIRRANGIVVKSGYEKDNWWAVAIPKSESPPPS